MQYQAHDHSDGIEAKLFPHGRRVVHLQDLTSYQEHDSKWEIPTVELIQLFNDELGLVHCIVILHLSLQQYLF